MAPMEARKLLSNHFFKIISASVFILVMILLVAVMKKGQKFFTFISSQINTGAHRSLYHQAEKAFAWQDCRKIAQKEKTIPYCVGDLFSFKCATPESVFTSSFTRCLGLAARNSGSSEICFSKEIINEVLKESSLKEPFHRDFVRDTCIRGYLGDEKFDPRFKENQSITKEQKRQALTRLCQGIEAEGYLKNKACRGLND